MFAGGTGVTLVPVPEKTARSHSDIKGRRPFDVPASNFMFHFNFLQWDVANPRTAKPVFSCIRTFLRALFPNGFKPLYGFRNQNYCRFRQMEQLLFARTKKEFIYIGFLALSSNFSCQTLGDCLCTLDAFHISNSIRYF